MHSHEKLLGGGCHEMAQSQYVRQSIQDWWKERIPYVILYPPHMYHGKWSFSGFLIAKSLSCSILVLLRLIVVFHSLSFGYFLRGCLMYEARLILYLLCHYFELPMLLLYLHSTDITGLYHCIQFMES